MHRRSADCDHGTARPSAHQVDALKYGISFYALTDFRAVIGVAIVSLNQLNLLNPRRE